MTKSDADEARRAVTRFLTQRQGKAVGEFNADGVPDLAVANSGSNTVTVLLAELTQTATATVTGISPAGPGTHLVEASYPGDSRYDSSVSTTTSLTFTIL